MEQVSFKPIGNIKDSAVADTITRWGRQLEYLFDVKLVGDDVHDSSVEGGKMVTVIDDRSTDLTFSPAAQASASTDPWYKFANDFFYYDNTATQGDGALAATQTVDYIFTGTEIQVIAAKSDNSGKVDIYIDGTLDTTVDCYAANPLSRAVIYSKTGLSLGRHAIKLQVRVDKNASSSAYYFFFDGFRINTPLGLKQVEIGVMQLGLSLTTNGNGYALADLVNYAPSGYSSLGIAGARLVTPNPNTGSNKPKIGSDGRYVIFYDGPVSNTVQAWIFFIVMRS